MLRCIGPGSLQLTRNYVFVEVPLLYLLLLLEFCGLSVPALLSIKKIFYLLF